MIPPIAKTPMPRPPAYGALWADMIDLLRRERSLIFAVSGFFLLLPIVMLRVVLPPVPVTPPGENPLPLMSAYFEQHQVEFLAYYLWVGFGQLVLATLLAAPDRPSVAEALSRSGRLFGWFLLQSALTLAILMGGVFMFILPALYFAARLSLCTVLLGAGEARTPIALVRRSLEMTRGAGWHIAAFLVFVWLGSNLFASAIGTISTTIFTPFSDWAIAAVADGLVQGLAAVPGLLLGALFPVSLWRALRRDP